MKVTAADIAQLLTSPPPRQVPEHVARVAQDRRGHRTHALIGFGVGIAGLFVVGILFPWRWIDELRLKGHGAEQATGVIQWVREANLWVNHRRVYEFGFAFTLPESGQVMTSCFATGRRWAQRERVPVRYLPSSPEVAVVAGGDLNKGGLTMVFVLLFPLAGFGIVLPTMRGRRRVLNALRHGHMAAVEVRSVEAAKMSLGKETAHRITMSSPTGGAGQWVVRRTDREEIDLLKKRASEKQTVFVLYDPRKPTRMIFPEAVIEQ